MIRTSKLTAVRLIAGTSVLATLGAVNVAYGAAGEAVWSSSTAERASGPVAAQHTTRAAQLAGTTATTKTVTVSTQAQLLAAVKAAAPGTDIRLNSGTYSGGLLIQKSGTAQAPIVIEPAGNGPVTLTANLPMPSCGASSPDINRTIRFAGGASYWIIQGMTIDGGIYITGGNAIDAHAWFKHLISTKNWQARRAVPGRGTNDPTAAHGAISYIAQRINKTLSPADGIEILNNTIVHKGIQISMGRYGTISGNSLSNIACGVGAGIWMGTYSDGWKITSNSVSNIANSTRAHYMQEGIRIDGASNYNVISGNTVQDLPGDGRGITTDQDASYNTFSGNHVKNVSIGYNDEMSGWHNQWIGNVVTGFRDVGYAFRSMDSGLSQPSHDTSTLGALVRCNTSTGASPDLQIGAAMQSTFQSNSFHTVKLSSNLRRYWAAQGNVWNGSSSPPPATVSPSLAGC